jgi:hypothetical protein
MKTLPRYFQSASLVTLGLIACGGANQSAAPGTATPTTVTSQHTDKAIVDKLATARCDQEQSCKNIGPGAKFASRDVCMDQLRGSIGNDLNAYDCPRGLDSEALNRCMAAIQSEECSHPFDTLTRFDKCRTGAICMK